MYIFLSIIFAFVTSVLVIKGFELTQKPCIGAVAFSCMGIPLFEGLVILPLSMIFFSFAYYFYFKKFVMKKTKK